MGIEVLRKALNSFRDVLLDNDACDHILSEYDCFHDLFSVFQADYDKQMKEAEEKQVEYAKLVAGQAMDYAEKMTTLHKQLSDIIVGHCSGYYHCKRNSYDELKELLEAGL